MYEALERAEQQNKRVEIVPDDDFLEGITCLNDFLSFHPSAGGKYKSEASPHPA